MANKTFFHIIAANEDLDISARIKILEYSADEIYCQGKNLLYLELCDMVKELKSRL